MPHTRTGRHCKFLHGERERESRPPRGDTRGGGGGGGGEIYPNGPFLDAAPSFRRMGSGVGGGGGGGGGEGGQGGFHVPHSFSSPALSSLAGAGLGGGGGGSGGGVGSPLRRSGSREDGMGGMMGGMGGGGSGGGAGGTLPANARITPCRFHLRGYCRWVLGVW